MREGFIVTIILGSVFVSGQIWEYFTLFNEGTRSRPTSTGRCSSSPPASTACTWSVASSPCGSSSPGR
ncbi:hypothetical protein [Tessaracoccus coleopterorum]